LAIGMAALGGGERRENFHGAGGGKGSGAGP
jgi:hypothetical protein